MDANDVKNDEELIERVAKAIWEATYLTKWENAKQYDDYPIGIDASYDRAKAAIAAFVDYYDPQFPSATDIPVSE